MKVYISPIFDATKEIPFDTQDHFPKHPFLKLPFVHSNFPSGQVVDPWTFYTYVHGIILSPEALGEMSCGFKTIENAEKAKERCTSILSDMLHQSSGVWCVYRNPDSNSGPRELDKLFRKSDEAYKYILKHKQSSANAITVYQGVSVKHTIYYFASYGGGEYSIRFTKYSDSE